MKTLVISGGSSGIGLATVERFLKADYQVFILDKQKPTQVTKKLFFLPCDVTELTQISAAIQSIMHETQTIDALVCNAGIHFSGTIQETTESDYHRMMDTNFKSAFFLTQALLPLLIANKNSSIVYVGSDQTLVGKPHSAIYGATKAALGSLAKTTALDYADFGIRSNLVAVGTVDTPLYQHAVDQYCQRTHADINTVHTMEAKQQPLNRIGKPQEIAELIYFLCSIDAGFITGAIYPIDGGYTAR